MKKQLNIFVTVFLAITLTIISSACNNTKSKGTNSNTSIESTINTGKNFMDGTWIYENDTEIWTWTFDEKGNCTVKQVFSTGVNLDEKGTYLINTKDESIIINGVWDTPETFPYKIENDNCVILYNSKDPYNDFWLVKQE